jgi:class 3 adenylate cyclase/tetratricopeptide (TPR) repeat protein
MQCPQCSNESRVGAKFCRKCGLRFDLVCLACGAPAEPDSGFCEECGAALAPPPRPVAKPAQVPRADRSTAPGSYIPQHLAERILTSRAALEGERKQVTVLFADLKGSMELLADRDPEDARRILDPVLERMMEAVHHYEGTVNQVLGDGIMALFGAPLAHEDHAVRACYAALRMQEAVKQHAQEVQRSEGVPIQIRVGLNSGEVVVRSIGSDLRMDYTAVGQTTHLAARMEQMALVGSILLAPETLRLAEGYVQVQALGPMQVKGLVAAVEIYELTGAGPARSRLQAAAARGLTRFVGRDAELDTLRRTLEQAAGSQGQLVALVGEPGVGKSRLVWEFTHSHRTQGWLVLESTSVSYGRATAYAPVIELLKSYCSIEARDDPRRIHEKVTGKVLTLDRALEPTLPALLALLGLPAHDTAWDVLDPPERRRRTLDAVKRLLLRESQVQPLLLVFEDLHWVDAETQTLLDHLTESLPTSRLLLLVNYRPEYAHTWHRWTYYQQLRLDPLPPASAAELLDALLGRDPSLAPLRAPLLARTEGNPFFLEESVRTLVETGALAGERGAYRLAQPAELSQVPGTVQAVLAARIDRLAPEDKRLLQAAAVIGKDVSYPLLQAIAELSEGALREGLARLRAAEFLYETSLFPDPEYTFKHALTHEVAYGGLLQGRRRALHSRIVGAVEALYPERRAEYAELLGRHALRGETWESAAAYLRQAGNRAADRYANREAVGFFEQTLEALAHLPASRATREQTLDVLFDLRRVLYILGETEQVLKCLAQAEAIAAMLNDERRQGRVLAFLTNQYSHLSDHQRSLETGERALTIAHTQDDFPLRMMASVYLARSAVARGDYSRALELTGDVRRSLIGELVHERWGMVALPAVTSRQLAAFSYVECGEFAEALACAEEARQIAEPLGRPLYGVPALWAVGHAYLRRGDLAEALPLLERALTLAREPSVTLTFAHVTADLGYGYAHAGRLAEAVSLLEEGMQSSGGAGNAAYRHFPALSLAEAYLLDGRLDDARPLAARVLEESRRHWERGNEAWALRLHGEIAAGADSMDLEQAESKYREALALAEELGMRPLVAHCHLGLGTLYRRVGRDAQAQADLAMAAKMYRAMEMTFWLARAGGELAP